MEQLLSTCRVAMLVTDGFEQFELEVPRLALLDAGATVHVIANRSDSVQGFQGMELGRAMPVDRSLSDCQASDYDALVLPGGVVNADTLRTQADAQNFVRQAHQAGKLIAVIGHGAWILVSCDLLGGSTLTSRANLKEDIQNAGAHWVDHEVVIDEALISSRGGDDLLAFNRAIVQTLAQTSARPAMPVGPAMSWQGLGAVQD